MGSVSGRPAVRGTGACRAPVRTILCVVTRASMWFIPRSHAVTVLLYTRYVFVVSSLRRHFSRLNSSTGLTKKMSVGKTARRTWRDLGGKIWTEESAANTRERGKKRKKESVQNRTKCREFADWTNLLLRGTIVNRTYGIHKKLCIYLFSLTIFGPIYSCPP